MENPLHETLRRALGTTFAFYLKAHGFHWNVEGPGFPQLHGLFGDIYQDSIAAVDRLAEELRIVRSYAPGSMGRMAKLSAIEDAPATMSAAAMLEMLLADSEKVLETLQAAYNAANGAGQLGLANYLQDRMSAHQKWAWMLRATARR